MRSPKRQFAYIKSYFLGKTKNVNKQCLLDTPNRNQNIMDESIMPPAQHTHKNSFSAVGGVANNKKNIMNLSSAEFAHSVLSIKTFTVFTDQRTGER